MAGVNTFGGFSGFGSSGDRVARNQRPTAPPTNTKQGNVVQKRASGGTVYRRYGMLGDEDSPYQDPDILPGNIGRSPWQAPRWDYQEPPLFGGNIVRDPTVEIVRGRGPTGRSGITVTPGGGSWSGFGPGYTAGMPVGSTNVFGGIFQGFHNGRPVLQAQSTRGGYGYSGSAPGGSGMSFAGGSQGFGGIVDRYFSNRMYHEGGRIQGPPSDTDNVFAHLATGEVVINSRAVQDLDRLLGGPGWEKAINGRQQTKHRTFRDMMADYYAQKNG